MGKETQALECEFHDPAGEMDVAGSAVPIAQRIENPWPDDDVPALPVRSVRLDEVADLPRARVRHRQQRRRSPVWERIVRELRRDLTTALITGPVVVPVWWGLWKVCDTLWTLKR